MDFCRVLSVIATGSQGVGFLYTRLTQHRATAMPVLNIFLISTT